jgi:hypothetical protein
MDCVAATKRAHAIIIGPVKQMDIPVMRQKIQNAP